MFLQVHLPDDILGLLSPAGQGILELLIHDGADTVVRALSILLDGFVLQGVEEYVDSALLVALQPEQLQPVNLLEVDRSEELVLVLVQFLAVA